MNNTLICSGRTNTKLANMQNNCSRSFNEVTNGFKNGIKNSSVIKSNSFLLLLYHLTLILGIDIQHAILKLNS